MRNPTKIDCFVHFPACFSMTSKPILNAFSGDCQRCFLCNELIKTETDYQRVPQNGLNNLKQLAERWSKVDASRCTDALYSNFRRTFARLESLKPSSYTPIIVHKSCCISFRTRITRKESQRERKRKESAENG